MSETDKENEGIVENDFHVEVKGGKDGIFSNDVLTNQSVEQTDEGKRCLSDADDDGEEKDKKEKKAAEVVGFFSLFRYASAFDGLLMFVAFICSMGNGIAQPASFIVFGQLIQKFIDFDKNTINDIAKEMRTFAIYYVIIAGGMFVCSFFQAAFWSLTAVRQTHKLRIKFFESILKQDIGWFDVNESGSLTTRLSDDLIKIQAGIGDKIGNLIQAMTMFFGGFGIGFFYSWELTLVILAVTPALMITGGITGKILASFSSKEQTAYASAGGVAEEVISSIKTVVAFNGENDEIVRFDDKLKLAEKAGVKKAMAIGGAMGLFHLVIFGCYALAFWLLILFVSIFKIFTTEIGRALKKASASF